MSKILLVDDDQALLKILTIGLSAHGYKVTATRRGSEAVEISKQLQPDIAVIDLGLPDLDGLNVLFEVKTRTSARILVLSAFHDETIKVRSLDAGADDYVTKPFGMGELAARLRVLDRLRRESEVVAAKAIAFDHLSLDPVTRTATVTGGTPVSLTKREFDLLRFFLENPDRLLTYRLILDAVWGPGYGSELQYVRVYVNRLRAKLGAASAAIRNVSGEGYVLDTAQLGVVDS